MYYLKTAKADGSEVIGAGYFEDHFQPIGIKMLDADAQQVEPCKYMNSNPPPSDISFMGLINPHINPSKRQYVSISSNLGIF